MKKINIPIILNVAALIFIMATFYWGFEQLFMTRLVLIFFALVCLLFEIKKDNISRNKMLFIIFSVVSLIAIVISILADNSSLNHAINNTDYLIPLFMYVLIVIMYKELYTESG